MVLSVNSKKKYVGAVFSDEWILLNHELKNLDVWNSDHGWKLKDLTFPSNGYVWTRLVCIRMDRICTGDKNANSNKMCGS